MRVADDLTPILGHVIEVIGTSEARLYEQVNSSFNWLLATLFAANGGAVVALVSRDAVGSPIPLIFFASGVVFSILMGLGNAVYASKAIMPTTDLRMTLTAFAVGQASFDQVKAKMDSLAECHVIKFAMYSAGGLSLSSLIAGMIAFACTVPK